MGLPITALTAAICALMLLLTAMDTVRRRMRGRIAFGDGGDAGLISAARSHGNLAEHAPLTVLMIGVLEQSHADHLTLTGIAVAFLAARALHIVGLYAPMSGKPPLPRSLGVIGTWLTMIALIGWIIGRVVLLNG